MQSVADRLSVVAPDAGAQRRAEIGPVLVDALTPDVLISEMTSACQARRRLVVMYANAHVVNLAGTDDRLTEALRWADLVYPDGVGVTLAARLLGARSFPRRMTAADFIGPACENFSRAGLRIFLLGGVPGAAADAAARLQTRWPGLVAGFEHGFVPEDRHEALVEKINASLADVLLVGMGSPKQELWIRRWAGRLWPSVLWCVGALIEQMAGYEPRSPQWLCKVGCEWLWRLMVRPRKCWRRYVLGNPRFICTALRQWPSKLHSR